MIPLLIRHWFMLALIAALVAGFLGWKQLQFLPESGWLKHGTVFVTMFTLTWPLPLGRIVQSFRRPAPVLIAFLVNLLFIPLMAWPLARVLGPELGPGLIVLAATPSTMASAAVLTRRAGGNDVVALINTLLTNGLCFLILPAWVWLLHGPTTGTRDFWGTASLLLMLVVVPMLLSQFCRIHRPVAEWATLRKTPLGVVSQSGIVLMVLLGSIQAGNRMADSAAPEIGLLLLMLAIVTALHVAAWWLGYCGSGWAGIRWEDRVAVGFSGSQKTLMIGLTTALELQLSILPLVVYHMLQLIIDTMIADRLRNPDPPSSSVVQSG